MESWIIWLIVAAVLGVAELVTVTFAFGIIAVAAVVAAVVGAFHLDFAIQLAAFVVAAGAGHRHRGPGRRRHVPPGTSWTVLSSRAAGHALPHECRSGEIPCRTWTVNCHQLHIIRWY